MVALHWCAVCAVDWVLLCLTDAKAVYRCMWIVLWCLKQTVLVPQFDWFRSSIIGAVAEASAYVAQDLNQWLESKWLPAVQTATAHLQFVQIVLARDDWSKAASSCPCGKQ
ncbi:hypothetical protein MRB53_035797 [Persea americana]|uniref:Uncharacterized protein n=1 Tax=Persea americana TaxID=3435 RepID=A0ACC2K5R9_PERAE|nr:hypothetical protein MRB53_035797 [Persea americana]